MWVEQPRSRVARGSAVWESKKSVIFALFEPNPAPKLHFRPQSVHEGIGSSRFGSVSHFGFVPDRILIHRVKRRACVRGTFFGSEYDVWGSNRTMAHTTVAPRRWNLSDLETTDQPSPHFCPKLIKSGSNRRAPDGQKFEPRECGSFERTPQRGLLDKLSSSKFHPTILKIRVLGFSGANSYSKSHFRPPRSRNSYSKCLFLCRRPSRILTKSRLLRARIRLIGTPG